MGTPEKKVFVLPFLLGLIINFVAMYFVLGVMNACYSCGNLGTSLLLVCMLVSAALLGVIAGSAAMLLKNMLLGFLVAIPSSVIGVVVALALGQVFYRVSF